MTYPQHTPQSADQDGSSPDTSAVSKPTNDTEHLDAVHEQSEPPAREPVLIRVVRILEAFTDMTDPLKLSQIKERADLPLTTTHRLVGALVAAGALEQVGPRRYQVGTRLIAVVTAGHIPVMRGEGTASVASVDDRGNPERGSKWVQRC